MKKYNSIARFGKRSLTEAVLNNHVVVMEKLDGANSSFTFDGELISFFSRSNILDEDNRLRGFYDWGLKHLQIYSLNEDYIYFGEWLVSHAIKYKPEAYSKFYMFDIFNKKTQSYMDFETVKAEAERLQLNMPEVFFEGIVSSVEEFEKYVGMSNIALTAGEGIVIKNYNYPHNNGNHVFIKIVSEEFQEVKKIKQKKLITSDALDVFLDSVLTPARIDKLIHKKIDLGMLEAELDISDMGTVLKVLGSDVYDDIVAEELDLLLSILKKKIGKKAPSAIREVINSKNKIDLIY